MRTAVSIDEEIYEIVQQIAFESRRTMDEVINELLIEGLRLEAVPVRHRQLGQLRGTITIADDFDHTISETIGSLGDLN